MSICVMLPETIVFLMIFPSNDKISIDFMFSQVMLRKSEAGFGLMETADKDVSLTSTARSMIFRKFIHLGEVSYASLQPFGT